MPNETRIVEMSGYYLSGGREVACGPLKDATEPGVAIRLTRPVPDSFPVQYSKITGDGARMVTSFCLSLDAAIALRDALTGAIDAELDGPITNETAELDQSEAIW